MSAGQAPSVSAVSRRNPLFPLGVDYHPHDAESAQPDEWYAGDFDADFAEFAEARLTLVRVFISWRAFEPQVGRYSEWAVARLRELVESAGAHRLRLVVCFFSGERHAGLLDVAWARTRDPRTDGYLMERQAALVRHVVGEHRSDRAVFAWELANEAFCSGFRSAEELAAWVTAMRDAVRELDEKRPVMVGADAETLFGASRVDAGPALGRSEVLVAHRTNAYQAYVAEGPVLGTRSTYLDGYLLHVSSRTVPVLLDGIGPHTLDASHAEEAAL
ncbi:MAG TPA: cellulase family glycosylhydrolase, partial [Coriobacteriia bacterium]|nr:cellulase family glycosylhydrolase [Coriobacteriia bacterium]